MDKLQLDPKERKRQSRVRIRYAVLNRLSFEETGALGPECGCCGERLLPLLTIDHSTDHGRAKLKWLEAPRSSIKLVHWLNRGSTPEFGLKVRCFNCNLGRERNGGICPHESENINGEFEFLSKTGSDENNYNWPYHSEVRMGRHLGTYVSEEEYEKVMLWIASQEQPLPMYDLLKALVFREVGIPYTPRPTEKNLAKFMKSIEKYRNRLAGRQIAPQKASHAKSRTNGGGDEVEPVSEPESPDFSESVPAEAVSSSDDAPGPGISRETESETEAPQESAVADGGSEEARPAERAPITPHPSYQALKGFSKRRR